VIQSNFDRFIDANSVRLFGGHFRLVAESLDDAGGNNYNDGGFKPFALPENHLVSEMVAHYYEERPHQAEENGPLIRVSAEPPKKKPKGRKESALPPDVVPHGDIKCRQRLGGLLKHYSRKAA
jgi:hypothetical protein